MRADRAVAAELSQVEVHDGNSALRFFLFATFLGSRKPFGIYEGKGESLGLSL